MTSSCSSSTRDSGSVARKRAWTQDEDDSLTRCIEKHGLMNWNLIPQLSGLNRSCKSCKLRWFNYLAPQMKLETFDEEEVDLIMRLHKLLGNRWSLIAGRIPGRTANDIENYWKCHMSSKEDSGSITHKRDWTQAEDDSLENCIEKHGLMNWSTIPQFTGLNRSRKSCKLRWLNYFGPQIKRETFDEDEVDLIIRLHKLLGNRWSLIAGRIPGKTANDIKNYWKNHLSTKDGN